MLVYKLSLHVTKLCCMCTYTWFIYISSHFNEKLIQKTELSKRGWFNDIRPKGGFVEQRLKNECSLPINA